MKFVINLEHVLESEESDVTASLFRIMEQWSHNIFGKPLTIDFLNIAETQTHKFIDSIETTPLSGHHFCGVRMHGRVSGLYLKSLFFSRLNNQITPSPVKTDPAIRAITFDFAVFSLIESENQHAFITHTNDLEVGQKIAIKNPKGDKAIIVEIDRVTEFKTACFINEFSLVDFD